MPRIGPSFLHQPLPSLAAINWRGFERWFVEGLSILASKSLREFGWRPAMRLRRLSKDGKIDSEILIERSLLGEQRIATDPAPFERMPIALEVNSSAVFETSVNLPAAARSHLREAVEHRLEQLSPLPPVEIAFAVGKSKLIEEERIETPVAIVRKATIEAIIANDETNSAIVGAAADANGRFAYVFRAGISGERRSRVLRVALALIGATVVLAFGLGRHIDRRIEAEEIYAEQLRAAVIAEKAEAAFLEDAPTELELGFDGAEMEIVIANILTALPKQAWIETIEASPTGSTATGYAPIGAEWPEGAAPNRTATDRPGVESFTLAVPREATP